MAKILIGRSDVDLDYPVCRPSLDLDFTQEELDPRITFTRGSIGTRVNRNRLIETVATNQPRFDYDPVTGECKGLLIEESRQNLLTYSEDFSNAAWTKSQSSIVSSNIIAPNGGTAFKLVENTASAGHFVTQTNISKASNAILTLTVFAKAGERIYLGLVINSFSTGFTNRYGAEFNLSNGTARNNNPAQGTYSNGSFSITPFPNGWYRCIITCTTSTDAQSQVRIFTFRDTNQWTSAASYQGDGTSGLYIWGAQLEAGAFPTSYIPTTASTVTRSADVASMTGTNFSSWYNQSEGSIVSNCITRRTDTGNVSDFAVLNSTNSSRIVSWFNDNKVPLFSVIANSNTVFLPTTNSPSNQSNIPIKKAISLADKNMRVSTNGNLITGDLGNTGVQNYLPTDFNRLLIGYEGVFAGYLNGTISRLTYYPRALKPNQLQYLTQ
jgi:hypothetical protein